jgi:uncharacterized damage-inducible protein DinB
LPAFGYRIEGKSRIPANISDIQTAMTVLEFLRHQFKHDSWANREELRVISTLPNPSIVASGLLMHIIAAQWLWFDRLQNNPQRTAVWPRMTLSDCEAQLLKLEEAWQSYLGGMPEEGLFRVCDYTNTRGEPWSNTVLDILAQLIVHGAHHRGQISMEIRNLGGVPSSVDYIHAVRKGLLG